jgi:hypothetical protein
MTMALPKQGPVTLSELLLRLLWWLLLLRL